MEGSVPVSRRPRRSALSPTSARRAGGGGRWGGGAKEAGKQFHSSSGQGGGCGPHLGVPVVVARHNLVQDALRPVGAGREGVVVDDVQDDPQAVPVERPHHRPELAQPARPVGVGGVRALGHPVVHGIVAPVVVVLVLFSVSPRPLPTRPSMYSPATARTRACGSSESGAKSPATSATSWSASRSGTLPKSYTGRRCTWLRPAEASRFRCRTPSEPGSQKASNFPRRPAGTVASSAEKSRTWSS